MALHRAPIGSARYSFSYICVIFWPSGVNETQNKGSEQLETTCLLHHLLVPFGGPTDLLQKEAKKSEKMSEESGDPNQALGLEQFHTVSSMFLHLMTFHVYSSPMGPERRSKEMTSKITGHMRPLKDLAEISQKKDRSTPQKISVFFVQIPVRPKVLFIVNSPHNSTSYHGRTTRVRTYKRDR